MVRRILGIVVIVIVLVYIAGFFRSAEINTTVQIDAPPDQVWEILTDLGSYRDWNPFLTQASGRVNEGAHLRVTIAPAEDGDDPMLFKPTILEVDENERLVWRGRVIIPGIFDGTHSFVLEETSEGGTTLTHSESFGGVGLFFMSVEPYEPMFVAMNEALKERAEAAANAEPEEGEGEAVAAPPDVSAIFNMSGSGNRLSDEQVQGAMSGGASNDGAMVEDGAMEEGTGDGAMMEDGVMEEGTGDGAMMEDGAMEEATGDGAMMDSGASTPQQ